MSITESSARPLDDALTSSNRESAAAPGRGGLSVHGKIDLCRGLLAYLVVVAHGLDIAWAIHPAAERSMSGNVHTLLQFTVGRGIIWVMGFFVISGYCIHLSVARLRDEARFPLKVYLVARLTRILPLYYVGLVFAVVVEWLIAPARPWVWPNGINGSVLISQCFVLQNLTQTFGSFAPSWSITNEVFYYGFYGLLCSLAFGKVDRPARVGMVICLLAATVMQTLYYTVAHTRIILGLGTMSGFGTIWFFGVLVAVHGQAMARSKLGRGLTWLWMPMIGLTMFWSSQARLWSAGVYLISGAAFALMVIGFLRADEAARPVSRSSRLMKWAGWVGMSSYPTYLFHGPLLMLLGSVNMRWGLVTDWRLTWAILSVAGIASGVVLGFVAEQPIMAWRSDLLKRLKSGRATSPRCVPSPVLGIQR